VEASRQTGMQEKQFKKVDDLAEPGLRKTHKD
jgi:hypothetical protein